MNPIARSIGGRPDGRLMRTLAALAPAAARAQFDHTHAVWTALLQKHVRVAANGVSSRVDYAGFAADPARLKAYLASLSAVGADEYAR